MATVSKIIPHVAIMHDRRRRERLEPLRSHIEQDYDGEIFVADGTYGGPWQALKFALCFMDSQHRGETHAIIVEDDAVLCRNFIPSVLKLIEHCPDEVIHLFGSEAQLQTRIMSSVDRGLLVRPKARKVIGIVGVVIPAPIVQQFMEWALRPSTDFIMARKVPSKPLTADTRLWYWMVNVRGHQGYVCQPSLVDHDGAHSLIGTKQQKLRKAANFIGKHVDGSRIQWTNQIMELDQ